MVIPLKITYRRYLLRTLDSIAVGERGALALRVWWYGGSMATTKVTFTLDRISMDRLQDAADRLAMAKSEVVREAIMEFHDRIGRLSDRERSRMLKAFDELIPRIPKRSAAEVDAELAEVRRARKAAGRRRH
jgi:hypothetical protein